LLGRNSDHSVILTYKVVFISFSTQGRGAFQRSNHPDMYGFGAETQWF